VVHGRPHDDEGIPFVVDQTEGVSKMGPVLEVVELLDVQLGTANSGARSSSAQVGGVADLGAHLAKVE
jgi:hypothetical protein